VGAAGPSHWFLVRYPRSARPARLEPRRHSHSYHDGEADLGPRHLYRSAIHYRTSEPCECLAVVDARDGVAVKQAICPTACRLRGMHPAPVGVGARNQQRRAHDGEAKALLRACRESRVSGHAVSGQSVSRESAEGGKPRGARAHDGRKEPRCRGGPASPPRRPHESRGGSGWTACVLVAAGTTAAVDGLVTVANCLRL
jgi:hypothetical protein